MQLYGTAWLASDAANPTPREPRRGPRRPGRMPTMSAFRAVFAVTLVVVLFGLLAACGSRTAAPSGSPSGSAPTTPPATRAEETSGPPAAALPLPSPVGESSAVQQPDGTFLLTPVSARIRGGVLYQYVAFTHCGFTPTTFDFDGSFWTVVNGAGEGGGANPPAGIGNPEDTGTIALVGPNEAVFTAQSGMLVALARSDGPQTGFPCD